MRLRVIFVMSKRANFVLWLLVIRHLADAFSEEFDIELAFVDYFSLINSNEVDAIYIATPHVYHYDLTKACILAGKAVLCEKPFTLNEAQF